MTDESNKKQVTTRNLVLGTSLILISNLIYVGNGYIVKWTELKAPEIALVRGVVQMILFGGLVWKSRKESQETKKEKLSLPTVLLLALYGFCVSSSSFGFLAAVPLMPIGDLIVVSFTSPVFSVFIDRVILKRPLT